MTTREQAVTMLDAEHGYTERYHGGRADKLASVLTAHPDARLVSCADEKTGQRFGQAKRRAGRCQKIGRTTFERQFWADWS